MISMAVENGATKTPTIYIYIYSFFLSKARYSSHTGYINKTRLTTPHIPKTLNSYNYTDFNTVFNCFYEYYSRPSIIRPPLGKTWRNRGRMSEKYCTLESQTKLLWRRTCSETCTIHLGGTANDDNMTFALLGSRTTYLISIFLCHHYGHYHVILP